MQITQRTHRSTPCYFRAVWIIHLILDWEEGDRELEGRTGSCLAADTQHLHLLERRRPAGRWTCQPPTLSPFVQASLCACVLLLRVSYCKPRWLPSPGGQILPCLSPAAFPPAQRGSPLLGTTQDRAGDRSGLQRGAGSYGTNAVLTLRPLPLCSPAVWGQLRPR